MTLTDDFATVRKALSWVGYNSPNESDRLRAFDAETQAKNVLTRIGSQLADAEAARDHALEAFQRCEVERNAALAERDELREALEHIAEGSLDNDHVRHCRDWRDIAKESLAALSQHESPLNETFSAAPAHATPTEETSKP